jgi:type I restriction enzyme S subunit
VKKSWKSQPLGDLCNFQRGLTYSKKDETDQPGTTVLRATNIDLSTNLLDLSDLRYIRDSVPVPDSKKIKSDRLLICTASGSKSHLGKVAYIDIDADYAFGGFMGMLTPKADLLPRFLFHAMTAPAYKTFIGSLTDGANINNLRFDSLARFQIPVPPLPEQRRIVAILDEAFEGIAAATACAASNLRKASDLFEAERSRAFSQRKSDWVTMPLSQLCRLINGRAYKKPELLSSGKYRVLRVGNFFTNTHWYYSDLELDPDKYCEPGDLLYAWSASFGPRIWEGEKAIFHYHIWRVIPDEKLIRKEFLHHLLAWDVDNIKSAHGTGTTMIHVSKGSMEAREVPVPSLEEQERLVRLLDDLAGESQRLAGLFSSKLAALELLKASLLHQAFTGAL